MTSYYDIVKLLLSTIQDEKPGNFKSLIESLSVDNKIIHGLIDDFGMKETVVLLSDVLKDMFDIDLIHGTVRPVKPDTNGGVDYSFTIERLTPKGLILNNNLKDKNLKDKNLKEKFIDSCKKQGAPIIGKAALNVLCTII